MFSIYQSTDPYNRDVGPKKTRFYYILRILFSFSNMIPLIVYKDIIYKYDNDVITIYLAGNLLILVLIRQNVIMYFLILGIRF